MTHIEELIGLIEKCGGSATMDEIATAYQSKHHVIVFGEHKAVMTQILQNSPAVSYDSESRKWKITSRNTMSTPVVKNISQIEKGDVVLNYFSEIKDKYPELVFTNINAKNIPQKHCVYIYRRDMSRERNVLFEIWRLSDIYSFDVYSKRCFLSTEENKEANKRKASTGKRGIITIKCSGNSVLDLLNFMIPKLDRAVNINPIDI